MKKENFLTHKFLPILSIFILISLIFLNNMSYASINLNYDNNTIILKDIDISSANYLMTYNPNDNMVELITAPQDSNIYFDKDTNSFYCANASYSLTNFNYYYCVLNDNYGGDWSSVTTKSSLSYSKKKVIKKVGNIYPCFKYRNIFIDKLPSNVTWEDNFCIFYSNGRTNMILATGEGVWLNTTGNGADLKYRTSYTSSSNLTLQKYVYSNNSWSSNGTATQTNGYYGELFYFAEDIINTDGTTFATGLRDFFFNPVTETTTMVTIPALETVEQIPTAIMATLKTIIPIGLIILSMVLVIYLIKSVILRAR